jgi:uncharacterized protein (DUF427 family)
MRTTWNDTVIAESEDTVVVDGQTHVNAAWYYPEPKPAAAEIAGRIAFWKGVQVS